MDQLAITVSDILNQAAGGIGDISSWLASNGLSGYAAATIAQLSAIVTICLVLIAVSSAIVYKCVKLGLYNDGICIDIVVIFAAGVLVICLIVMAFAIPQIVGWMASPDGMLLDKLVSAISYQ